MSGPPPGANMAQSRMEMAKNIKDEDKLYKFEGVIYSTIMSPVENLEAARTMEARADDVMLVAYPKCGFNWMVAVLRKIMAAVSGKKDVPDMPPLIEFFSPDVQKQLIAQQPSPRFLGTHLHPDNIPASFKEKKTKMLVVWRNPKDTVVSFYHFMNKNPVLPNVEWDKFFTDFMSGEVPWGSYFDQALAWDKLMDEPNVKIITYEDLKQDLSGGIKEISQFFGFPLTEEQVQTIYSETTFSAMKEGSSHGKMGSIFFRKGEVGDWKNHFSEAQNQQMDEEFNKRLAGTKLGAKLKYDTYCNMSLSAAQQGGAPTWRQARMEMAKRLKDEEKLYLFDGTLYPVVLCPAENMEALRTLRAGPDDLVLLSFPKCGFNWMVAVLRKMMVAIKGKTFSSDMPPQIEFCSPEMQKTIEREPSPRLLGNHSHPKKLPLLYQSIRENKTKTLMMFRNPKDTAVSYFHFMNSNPALPSAEWDKFFSDFMSGNVTFGSYLDHIEACTKLADEPNVMTVIYEELKEDLTENVRRIAQFLEFPLTEEQVQAISAESTFSAMKENAVNTHGQFGNVLFRKGEVGDWKNHFSEAQSQQMDEEFNKRLAGTKLGAKLKYDTYCK